MNTKYSYQTTLSILIALMVLFSGCQKKTVNGQVFIVSQGAESHKLALVPIYYLNEDNIKLLQIKLATEFQALKTKREQDKNSTAERVEDLEAKYKASQQSLAQAQKKRADVGDAVIKFSDRSTPANATQTDFAVMEFELNGLEKKMKEADSTYTSAKRECEKSKLALEEANTLLDNANANVKLSYNDLVEIWGRVLNQFQPSAKTDIDGTFILNDHVTRKNTLVAFAKRMVGSEWEKYLWVGILPDKLTNDKLLLSNDNQLPKEMLTDTGFTPSQF